MTGRLLKKSALVTGGLLVCGGGIALFVLFVFGLRKDSEPYQYALALAKADARVQAALGELIREGFVVGGDVIGERTEGGQASLSIPISGPKGSGAILVVAARSAGRWHYSTIRVTVAGQAGVIDLLTEK
jgi:Cytochrome oxidase complex assembly protein 1